MRRIMAIAAAVAATLPSAWAEIPRDYYRALDGKAGDALVGAMTQLAAGHDRVTYNTKTWGAFEKTDTRMLNGREIWWDMYSNNIVYTEAHASLNIEHAVANSWWGGRNGSADAYADLFHLNPSDQNANNKKSNNPPGKVVNASILDNGVFRIGPASEGQGGGSKNVFEPADEYKGDFARAYFYILTAYRDISWHVGTDKDVAYVCATADGKTVLAPWAAELLLEWHRLDPVDSKELNRQEEIYKLQKNRNPFIDYPELAEYIWGNRKGEPLSLAAITPAEGIERPAAPVFGDCRLTAVNTYSRRWWDAVTIPVSNPGEELWISIDNGEYYQYGNGLSIDAATPSASHSVKAYSVAYTSGREMRSPTAYLTMTPFDPEGTDYSMAKWTRCLSTADISTETHYIILSDNTLHCMSTRGGTTATAFMEDAGFADFTGDEVTELPVDAAIVRFHEAPAGQYSLGLYDIHGEQLGFWRRAAGNKMSLNPTISSPGTVSFTAEGIFRFTFDDGFTLYFNPTQPRFTNYAENSSTKGPVRLYRFKEFGVPSAVEAIGDDRTPVTVSGHDIFAPEGWAVYDLNGRRVTGRGLTPGIYIVAGREGAVKVAIGR